MAEDRKIKSAEEWVDGGVPLPSGDPLKDKPRYVRWVAMIQEDAVKCYETSATIEEVEEAWKNLSALLDACNLDADEEFLKLESAFTAKLADLAKLKMPV